VRGKRTMTFTGMLERDHIPERGGDDAIPKGTLAFTVNTGIRTECEEEVM